MSRVSVSELLLRIALALAFLYPPISALSDPYSWIGYFPSFLTDLAGSNAVLMLHAFGVVEAAIALWILFGKRIFIPSSIAALMLLAIIAFNFPQFPILFRDVSIALAALALAWMHRPQSLHGALNQT